MKRGLILAWMMATILGCQAEKKTAQSPRRLLYVVTPGIRNDLQYGGAGIVVYDIDAGYSFVKRLSTTASREEKPDNIKGVCANAATGRLYFTTPKKIYCFNLLKEEVVWEKIPPHGADRMSITPDGKTIYVPSFEKDTWNVLSAADGQVIATIETRSGAHNTLCSLDGRRMYLAGLKSPILSIADTATHRIAATAGPFSAPIRPFTVNGRQTRCYVCVNDLLGFEIGDLETGLKLARVQVQGFSKGPVARHGCPSHGVGLTPDEKELWLCDAHNRRMHVFDLTANPPRQIASIACRQEPGWITFSLDGKHAWPSTGQVIDTATKRIIATLGDPKGGQVHSEKMIEIQWLEGRPYRIGDQFGLGRVMN